MSDTVAAPCWYEICPTRGDELTHRLLGSGSLPGKKGVWEDSFAQSRMDGRGVLKGWWVIVLLGQGRAGRIGDVVRISPNELSFATVQAHRDIYSTPSRTRKPFLKCDKFYNNGDVTNLFYELDPVEHGKMRKILAPGFSGVAIKKHEHIIHQYVDMFVRKVTELSAARRGLGIDANEAIPWLAFDVMGELTFGESFDAVAKGETHMWITVLNDSAHAAILPSFVRRAPSLILAVPFLLSLSAIRNLRRHYAYTLQTVRRRMNRPAGDRDLFAPMLERGDVDERHLVALAQAMIIAGADTATNVMTTALYFLCATPGAMAKVEAEVRALTYEQLTGEELPRLKYLNAVIEEAMRCFPPIAFGLPRVSPGETIDGRYIPKGVRVSVSHWVLGHNPRVWDRPHEFRPERWLKNESDDGSSRVSLEEEKKKKSSEAAHFPFSSGPRSCLGMAQAYLEMRITLAKLIHACDMRVTKDPGDWIGAAQMHMMWKRAPWMVHFERREEGDSSRLEKDGREELLF
ncbi:hypothetical protein Hte_006889 [Hypoxylon texense]